MEASREELTSSMREMSDEELLRHLRSDPLTPLGIEVATSLLRSRGIQPPARTIPPGTSEVIPSGQDTGDELVTVAEYLSPIEAGLLRGCLEARGIFVNLWGEHVGEAQVVLPAAGGGAHLQVRRDQLAQAQEVLAAWERGDLEIPAAS